MRAGAPSRTAIGVAKRRAAHQVLDHPVIFQDPLAERIVDDIGAPDWRGSRLLRAFVAARSRYAEDQLAAFFARGVRQYVVLGAGLDTFAYRNPYGPALQVFEVDHPDTQAWKRNRLHAAGIVIPDSLQFIPVNFEEQELKDAMENALAFDPGRPAFFSLLGVTPYLTEDAFLATLGVVASLPAGSGVVFDYAVPAASLKPLDQIRLKILSTRVANIGEAFQLFLEPEELAVTLGRLGFTGMEDLGQQEINSRYFQGRTDGLRIGGEIGRLFSGCLGGPDRRAP